MSYFVSEVKKKSLYFFSFASGSISVFAYSPFDIKLCIVISIALLFYLVRDKNIQKAVGIGCGFGLGLYSVGISWIYVSIHEFGNASVSLSVLLVICLICFLTTIFVVPKFILYVWLRNRLQFNQSWMSVWMFASVWIFWDWVASWLLTGFPWLYSGYVLLDTPLQVFAPILGIYGLSFIVILMSALIIPLFIVRSEMNGKVALLSLCIAVVCLISFFLDEKKWTVKTSSIRISSIQGNIPQELKWKPDHVNTTLDLYKQLTEKSWGSDVIFWPENAIPILYSEAEHFLKKMGEEAEKRKTAIVSGIPIDIVLDDGTLKNYNGSVAFGNGSGRYMKAKLVPFGEYIPLEYILRGLISFFDMPMSSFTRGSDSQGFLIANNTKISNTICYEIIYPDFVAMKTVGSELLLTMSNDTWFGDSIGPAQHFQMARMRALETGRYLVRSTNDGITAIINDQGQVEKKLPRFEVGVLTGNVNLYKGSTPFMMYGSWIVLGFNFFILTLCVLLGLYRKRCRI